MFSLFFSTEVTALLVFVYKMPHLFMAELTYKSTAYAALTNLYFRLSPLHDIIIVKMGGYGPY